MLSIRQIVITSVGILSLQTTDSRTIRIQRGVSQELEGVEVEPLPEIPAAINWDSLAEDVKNYDNLAREGSREGLLLILRTTFEEKDRNVIPQTSEEERLTRSSWTIEQEENPKNLELAELLLGISELSADDDEAEENVSKVDLMEERLFGKWKRHLITGPTFDNCPEGTRLVRKECREVFLV